MSSISRSTRERRRPRSIPAPAPVVVDDRAAPASSSAGSSAFLNLRKLSAPDEDHRRARAVAVIGDPVPSFDVTVCIGVSLLFGSSLSPIQTVATKTRRRSARFRGISAPGSRSSTRCARPCSRSPSASSPEQDAQELADTYYVALLHASRFAGRLRRTSGSAAEAELAVEAVPDAEEQVGRRLDRAGGAC